MAVITIAADLSAGLGSIHHALWNFRGGESPLKPSSPAPPPLPHSTGCLPLTLRHAHDNDNHDRDGRCGHYHRDGDGREPRPRRHTGRGRAAGAHHGASRTGGHLPLGQAAGPRRAARVERALPGEADGATVQNFGLPPSLLRLLHRAGRRRADPSPRSVPVRAAHAAHAPPTGWLLAGC